MGRFRQDGRARPRRGLRSLVVSLALVLSSTLVGCRTSPPEAFVSRDFGVVRAATVEQAGRVSDHAEEILPRIIRVLPDLLDREIEVWVQDRIELYDGSPYPEHIAGMADFARGRIHLRDADERVRIHLAHELVHVLLGPSWQALPGVMEEGLCDLVAALVVPTEGRLHHVKRLVEASGFFGGIEVVLEVSVPWSSGGSRADGSRPTGVRRGLPLRRRALRVRLLVDADRSLDPLRILALDESEVFDRATGDDGVGLYGMGYLFALAVVGNVGLDGLNGLCLRATEESEELVPPAWILRASGLSAEMAHADDAYAIGMTDDRDAAMRIALSRALSEYLGPSELPELAEILADSLGRAAVDSTRQVFSGYEADEFLRAARPALSLRGRRGSVSLRVIPEFVDAVRAAWDEPRDESRSIQSAE